MADLSASAIIRDESPTDIAEIREVHLGAFESAFEADLVDALRASETPTVSLVAVVDDRGVGHLLFSPVTVEINPGGISVWGLGPLAVLPELQRRGIGGDLIRHGLESIAEHGAEALVVLGHADYYPRFGFRPASERGLRYRSQELDAYFMARELRPGALDGVEGRVEYAPEIDQAG